MAQSCRVLVTGASGLLGRAVMQEFADTEKWKVLGLAFSRVKDNLRKCDITKEEEIQKIFEDFKPQFILHCAAERRPDVVDKQAEATYSLNVTASKRLAQLAASCGAVMVYISTDYVFDGRNPPYKEDSNPNPLNKYGQSKLDGEVAVLDSSQGHIVVRVPILYGQVENLEESAVTVIFNQVKDSSRPCSVCHFLRRYPTHVADVAVVLRQLLEKRLQDPSLKGILHWSGKEMLTKYDMAMVMGEIFELSTGHMQPSQSAPSGAERPEDAKLDTSYMQSLGIGQTTHFRDGIKSIIQKFV